MIPLYAHWNLSGLGCDTSTSLEFNYFSYTHSAIQSLNEGDPAYAPILTGHGSISKKFPHARYKNIRFEKSEAT